ncbi:MAG: hypothetical protein ACJAZM_002218 [Cyclobacteriaceae bacterium]|jgi:hypothetical protein
MIWLSLKYSFLLDQKVIADSNIRKHCIPIVNKEIGNRKKHIAMTKKQMEKEKPI